MVALAGGFPFDVRRESVLFANELLKMAPVFSKVVPETSQVGCITGTESLSEAPSQARHLAQVLDEQVPPPR